MRLMRSMLFGMALAGLASAADGPPPAPALAPVPAPPCCPAATHKVCVPEVAKRTITHTHYAVKCVDICLPHCSGGACKPCADGGECGKVRQVRRLVKRFVKEEACEVRCVPKEVPAEGCLAPCPAPCTPACPSPCVGSGPPAKLPGCR